MTPTRTGTAAPRCAGTAVLDEAEEFPAELCAALDTFGLPARYVPTREHPASHSAATRCWSCDWWADCAAASE
ncbi:hypothetical protein [Kitasatospora acidiphila]|uniref:hypothetical protein n=1 Tax=Kitasatospora acidiphila TaxID=2567942 RepID=UPI001C673B5B|nr:hypothetical protein [Kitasatospora acidiphila]